MEDTSAKQLLEAGGGEERVDRLPCDEGDKSFFYSLHCGHTKRRCPHCRQWVCPYHFEPNGEGVVGGHSNCAGRSRSSHVLVEVDLSALALDPGVAEQQLWSPASSSTSSLKSSPSKSVLLAAESTDEESTDEESSEEGQAGQATLTHERSSNFTRGLHYSFQALGVLLVLGFVGGIGYIIRGARLDDEEIVAHVLGQEEVHWEWGTVPWCVLVVLIVLVCGTPSIIFCIGQMWQAANKGIMPRLCPSFLNVGKVATEEAMPRYLASESVLGGLVTLVGVILGLCFVEDGGEAPVWLLPLCLPYLLRTKIIEVRLLPFYGGAFSISSDVLPFLLSALEVFDRYSDGITLAVLHASRKRIETRWVNTFWRNPSPVVQSLAPLFTVIYLWHISAFALLISVAQQQVIGMDTKGLRKLPTFGEEELRVPGYGPEAPQAAVGADIGGFGALAGRFEKRSAADGRGGIVKVALGFTKSLVENMPQGMLATIHLGLQGQPLTGDRVVLVSAVVSTMSLVKQGVSVLQGSLSISRAAYSEDAKAGLAVFTLVFPMGLLILVCSAFLATKLAMIELCPKHAWSLTAGCIDLADFD